MTDAFQQIEDQIGIRAPWNVWPHLKHEQIKASVPLSVLYTPLRQVVNPLRVSYTPIKCAKCGAVLNPYDPVDYNSKQYQCVYCGTQQMLPSSYYEISAERKPAELHSQYRCLEYELQQVIQDSKCVIFAIDVQCPEGELERQKQSVQMALDLLEDDMKVGLITYGTTVNVHEVNSQICPRRVVFRGTCDMMPNQVDQFLGLKNQMYRFILPLSECRENFYQTIEDLSVDPWSVAAKHRPFRSTGLAVSIGISILHSMHSQLVQYHKNPFGKLIILSSGPCTSGPGYIVDPDITQHLRHWPDIYLKNEQAKFVKDCQKYYEKLIDRALESNTSVHLFSSSIDQTGIYEMQELCRKTCGSIVLSESFQYQAFTRSWRLFVDSLSEQAELLQYGAGLLSVSCSNQIRVNGILGPCSSLKYSGPSVAQNEIGEGLSDRWRLNSLDSDLTLAVFFDLADQPRETALQNRFLYFRTEFSTPQGKRVLRVVSYAFKSDYNENLNSFLAGFDQEAAACVLARMAVARLQLTSSSDDAVRAIDRICIKLARIFATFVPNDPKSVRFAANFEFFPQFLYHFRRSELINLFGQSPDETAMKHFQLMRQGVTQMLAIMQPALIAYSINNLEGEPVFLDSSECLPDRVLVLDSFFNVLVWTGQTVAAWREAGYHLKPEYANVAKLLVAFKDEVESLLAARFPSPRYDEADQGGSQARILLARVNPSHGYAEQGFQGEHVATDDANMQSFLDVLKKTVCSPEQ